MPATTTSRTTATATYLIHGALWVSDAISVASQQRQRLSARGGQRVVLAARIRRRRQRTVGTGTRRRGVCRVRHVAAAGQTRQLGDPSRRHLRVLGLPQRVGEVEDAPDTAQGDVDVEERALAD